MKELKALTSNEILRAIHLIAGGVKTDARILAEGGETWRWGELQEQVESLDKLVKMLRLAFNAEDKGAPESRRRCFKRALIINSTLGVLTKHDLWDILGLNVDDYVLKVKPVDYEAVRKILAEK